MQPFLLVTNHSRSLGQVSKRVHRIPASLTRLQPRSASGRVSRCVQPALRSQVSPLRRRVFHSAASSCRSIRKFDSEVKLNEDSSFKPRWRRYATWTNAILASCGARSPRNSKIRARRERASERAASSHFLRRAVSSSLLLPLLLPRGCPRKTRRDPRPRANVSLAARPLVAVPARPTTAETRFAVNTPRKVARMSLRAPQGYPRTIGE